MGERDEESLDRQWEAGASRGEAPQALKDRDVDNEEGRRPEVMDPAMPLASSEGQGGLDDSLPAGDVEEAGGDDLTISASPEPEPALGEASSECAGPAPDSTDDGESTDAEFVPVQPGTSMPNRFGEFLSEGVESVRALSAAHRAHAEARDGLEALDRSLDARTEELAHRRDVEGRFDEIVAEESQNLASAEQQAACAQEAAERLRQDVAAMRERLDAVKDEDAANERRLKAARESAEAKEASARESAARLQRRLDDARRNLDRAMKERDEGLTAARAEVDAAQEHLSVLRAEYAEIRRNPSANSAGYTVRSAELESEISDAVEVLRNAQAALPALDRETEGAIELARRMVAEAERPIAAARASFDEVVAAADRARDIHDEGRRDADDRQKEMRRAISEREKELRGQERERDAAQQRAEAAAAALDEAHAIHADPAATEALAASIASDRLRRDELSGEVERLAAEEDAVRDSTRSTRTRFLAAIASVVVFLMLMLAWTFVAQ